MIYATIDNLSSYIIYIDLGVVIFPPNEKFGVKICDLSYIMIMPSYKTYNFPITNYLQDIQETLKEKRRLSIKKVGKMLDV